MYNYVDRLLDRITMYKLLFYYLLALVLAAIGLSFAGVLHFSASSIVISTAVIVLTCWIANKVFAYIFDAPTNVESVYITALILALIIAPFHTFSAENLAFLLAASGLAMASKYILTINKKHIFNPAAIAVVLTALGPRQSADWWVGTSAMLPFVVIGGVLLVRKIHRGRMVLTFFVSALLATILYTMLSHGNVFSTLDKTLMSSSMFFLGFVMLTEPLTTPPTATKQTWYAALVGIVFPPQFHVLNLYSTPELALVVSNVFSYIVSPRVKLFPTLKQKIRISPDCVDFVFTPHSTLTYEPGQYMEWTLPHHGTDARGNRRYFTLASSPTELDVRVDAKFYDTGSSYKKAMLAMDSSSPIVADHIAGDFVLPKNPKRKLVFIAGGIGVTPYRSMIKYLIDTKEPRSITLLYSAKTQKDFVYTDVFEQARGIGVRTVYVVTGQGEAVSGKYARRGRIDAEMITRDIPDYVERTFYISGTQSMVRSIQHTLRGIGVPSRHIKVDYFSGYA